MQLAAALALDGYVESAKGAIQVLGGMGFTWEHDAHVHLRRATTLRQLVGGTAPLRAESARLALAGWRRRLRSSCRPRPTDLRAELDGLLAGIAAIEDPAARQRALADHGLLAPHWPSPWGRDAGAVEQLVIDQVFAEAGLNRPDLAVAAWALPTIIAHGTDEQTERFVGPTMRGEIIWCQLFSEPGAGSDLAVADHAGHQGRRRVVADGAEGVDVGGGTGPLGHLPGPDRPRRAQAPGHHLLPGRHARRRASRSARCARSPAPSLFNEVFFDDCFVPDECVVGEIDGGWKLARTTLANERVSLSSDSAFGGALEGVLARVAARPELQDPVTLDRLGHLLAEAQSLAQLGMRATLRSVGGLQPGSGVERAQAGRSRVRPAGPRVRTRPLRARGRGHRRRCRVSAYMVLQSKCMTIAGGTSEVQRNVIGERLLGLPRDPEPGR